jgi:molybdopterin-binding protein
MQRSRAYTASEAARALGISLDTLRRWDKQGRIKTRRDAGNRRLVPAKEVERLRGEAEQSLSARNRFRGVVEDVRVEGLLAQVEIVVTEPARIVAVITRDSAEALGLEPGMPATGIVKATSVMVER